ncbi:hypothetical protein IWQ62_004119 [Dispira parvispora]|uniref:Ribonuclease H2 subunit B wHTH domain-containing protein n=1 Tax=Dispira parvispora TaxID=1520584 RepID=A0A9W8E5P7_9FUNG|nr:hypothetical protein IWQ62_004119 [Dispira parvispora]
MEDKETVYVCILPETSPSDSETEANNRKRDGFDGVFMMMSDLLEHPDFPDVTYLQDCPTIESQLALLCDIKPLTDTEKVYRLSEPRVLRWLTTKINSAVTQLTQQARYSQVNHNLFFLENPDDPLTLDRRQQFFADMLGEYLNDHWLDLLLTHYNNFEALEKQRQQLPTRVHELDRPEDYTTHRPTTASSSQDSPAKKAKTTTASRSLAKANLKGMKSMMSYFAKKT